MTGYLGERVTEHGPPSLLRPTPFRWRPANEIEPRRFLYGRHYIRGVLSVTVAPGGVGKSSLSLVDALAMVTGRNLIGDTPLGQLRVWYLNLEDDREELDRRIAALCLHYGISERDIGGRLFVDDRDLKLVLASEKRGSAGVEINDELVSRLEAGLMENHVDVMILDPLVKAHRIAENDNGKIDRLASTLSELARTATCSIDTVHHSRKIAAGQGGITIDDARGASALIAASRAARTLSPMTKEEADKAVVQQPRSFFRVDDGKGNLTPPPERTAWRQLVGVDLGNARPDRPADNVAVVTAWEWPSQMAGVTIADLREVQRRVAEGAWRVDTQAKDWVGNLVAEVLQLDVHDPVERKRIKELLQTWKKSRMFKEEIRKDGRGNDRKFFAVEELATD